jgi:hypothetical protein
MRKVFKLALFLPAVLFAQQEPGYHEHDGFFLSMSAGPAFGAITLDADNAPFNKVQFSGAGGMFDFKIGGTIARKVSISFDIISRAIVGPDIEVDGVEGSASDEISARDATYGVGLTYYVMPANILLSASIGTGLFTFADEGSNIDAESENGLALQFKLGKEWWVGRNWGLGLSGGVGILNAKDKEDPSNPSYSGEMSTVKLFVLFNTTYN